MQPNLLSVAMSFGVGALTLLGLFWWVRLFLPEAARPSWPPPALAGAPPGVALLLVGSVIQAVGLLALTMADLHVVADRITSGTRLVDRAMAGQQRLAAYSDELVSVRDEHDRTAAVLFCEGFPDCVKGPPAVDLEAVDEGQSALNEGNLEPGVWARGRQQSPCAGGVLLPQLGFQFGVAGGFVPDALTQTDLQVLFDAAWGNKGRAICLRDLFGSAGANSRAAIKQAARLALYKARNRVMREPTYAAELNALGVRTDLLRACTALSLMLVILALLAIAWGMGALRAFLVRFPALAAVLGVVSHEAIRPGGTRHQRGVFIALMVFASVVLGRAYEYREASITKRIFGYYLSLVGDAQRSPDEAQWGLDDGGDTGEGNAELDLDPDRVNLDPADAAVPDAASGGAPPTGADAGITRALEKHIPVPSRQPGRGAVR